MSSGASSTAAADPDARAVCACSILAGILATALVVTEVELVISGMACAARVWVWQRQ